MFRKLLTAQAATLVALASLLAVSQVQAVTIGSFDGSRSGRLFSGSDYDNIRTHLADPANFGPAGIVNDTVTFAPDIATASAATLAGTDIFVLTETNSLSNGTA